MKGRLVSRARLVMGVLVTMVALVSATAWSEPGSPPASAEKEEQKKAQAPALMVVTFHADWCGTCRTLNPKVEEVQGKLAEQPVLFLKLDLTDEKTRHQAELLASVLRMDDAWVEHGQKTGFALLVKPRSGEVAGRLAAAQTPEQMHASIAEHVEKTP